MTSSVAVKALAGSLQVKMSLVAINRDGAVVVRE
jgi:hypothetical protein